MNEGGEQRERYQNGDSVMNGTRILGVKSGANLFGGN